MTGHEIYNEGYEAGYEAAVAEFLEYGPATEDILDGFANFGSGFSKLFRGVRIRSISVQNMIRNGMSEKEAVSRMKELVAYLRRSELLKEDIDPSVINKNFVLEKSDLTPTGRKYMDSITDALHDKRTMDSVANKIVHNAKKKRSDIDDDFHTTFLYIPMAAECIAWAPVTCGATLLAGALTAVVCEGIRALIKGIFNTDSSYSIASIIEDKVDMRKLKRGTRYAEESADLFDFDNLDEYNDAMEAKNSPYRRYRKNRNISASEAKAKIDYARDHDTEKFSGRMTKLDNRHQEYRDGMLDYAMKRPDKFKHRGDKLGYQPKSSAFRAAVDGPDNTTIPYHRQHLGR